MTARTKTIPWGNDELFWYGDFGCVYETLRLEGASRRPVIAKICLPGGRKVSVDELMSRAQEEHVRVRPPPRGELRCTVS